MKMETFNSNTVANVYETASYALAAQTKAMVESRYIMAMRNPRDWNQVRVDILKECNRPKFAESAYYIKPIGKGVEGLSIRYVEAALRCMKNVLIESSMIFEDEMKEIHRVSVTDLEANTSYPVDVKVSKTVERSKPLDDGSFISCRTNSYGKMTYTVIGSDDDLLNKRGSLISKAIRSLGMRIIPGDITDESAEVIKRVRMADVKQDPSSHLKKMVDSFGVLGITPSDLKEYTGVSLTKCSPAEIENLRQLYTAIKDGETTWRSVIESVKKDETKLIDLLDDAVISSTLNKTGVTNELSN